MARKNTEVIPDLFSNRIIFETKSGSVGITTNNNGQLVIGALSAPGTANTLIIDPINNKIQTSEIRFLDGTYIDSAATFNGGVSTTTSLFTLKANKLFFKYDSSGNSIPEQIIQLKIQKSSDIIGAISFSFSPNPTNNISLTQIDSLTWNLTLSEFEKANSDTLSITATVGAFSDVISIFKASDGLDAIAGGLTNPFVSIPVESDGTIDSGLLSGYLTTAGGQFIVFKGGQELTGDSSLVTYSVASVTQGLSININSNGIYTISNFDVIEEDGQAILTATDNDTGQQFKTKFSILTVRKGQAGVNGADGATGAAGPTGATGPAGSAGLNAKTVKLSVDDAQIAYSASNLYPAPIEIQVTASQQNHTGIIYYEFAVYEGAASSATSLINSISNTLLLTDTNKNYGLTTYKFINDTKTEYGKSKTLKVITREGSATSTPISEDSVTIIATKDGSDSLDVVFPNNNHTFPANADGTVDAASYSGGGSLVEAYIGNEQLIPTISTLSNGKFKVTVSSNSNIVPGSVTTDIPNKRMILGDPSAMSSSNTADITYLIEGTDSKGLSRSSLVKTSFTKSKKGDAGANGIDGLSGILTNESHTIAASSSGEIFDFGSSALANAGGTFNIYTGGTSINSFCTFSIINGTTSKIQNGLTASINPTTGLYSLNTLDSTSWTSNSEIFTFKAVSGSSSIEKTYTIVKSLGGANAKIIVLKSTAQTFKKDTNGSYSPSVQTVEFTSSLKNIIATPSWTVDNSSTGVSANGAISTKLNVSADGLKASMSANQFDASRNASGNSFATIKISAIENSITYDDAITVQLVQDGAQGATGPAGSAGNNARAVELTSNKYQIPYDSNNSTTVTSITLTAAARNTTGSLTYNYYKNGTLLEGPISSNTKIINSSLPQPGFSDTYSVSLFENGVLVATDPVPIFGTKDGSDAVTISAPNNNHTFTADVNGSVQTYDGSGTTIDVFVGNTALTATTSATVASGQFKVTSVVSNGTITLPTPTASGTTITIGNLSAFTTDNATVTYTITLRRLNSSTDETFTVVATYSKSKVGAQGVQGVQGVAGSDASSGILTNESHTIAASSSGEIYNYSANSFNTAGGTFKFYKGATLLSSGVTYSIFNGTSTVSSLIQNGLTASMNTTSGVYTLSVANSSSWTTNAESFTFRAVSGSTTIDKIYTIVKSLGGANAKILTLFSNAQTFKKNTNGSYSPSPQTVTFTANLQNLTGTPTWTINGNSAGSNLGISTNTATMTNTQFDNARGANDSVTIKASIIDGSTTYSDEITVNLLQDGAQGATGATGATGAAGADASSGLLTNESHTIAASSSGEIYNYSANSFNTAGGTFKFYKGASLLTSGVAYSIFNGTTTVASLIQNGLTASMNSSTGVYTISVANSSIWTSNTESFIFRAISGSTTIDKTYTIVKSLGGANAKILTLLNNKQTFKKNTNGIYSPSPQTITFTANLQNLTGTPSWTLDGIAAGSNLSITSNTATMSNTHFDNVSGSNGSVTVKATLIESGVTYSDEVTINAIQDGATGLPGTNAVNGLLTNEAFTIAASSSGEIVGFSSTVYNQGSGSFNVYNGNSLISTSLLSFKVGNSSNAVSGTPSSIIQNGLTASIDTSGIYRVTSSNSTGWTSDSESFLFTATSGSTTLNKSYSIVKSKGGVNAKILSLGSTGLTFKKDTVGAYSPASQTIAFTASLQNITTPVTWSVDGATTNVGNGSGGAGTGTIFTVGNDRLSGSMTQAQFTVATGSKNFATVKASVTEGGTTYSDSMTVTLLQDGAQGATGASTINGFLTNESHNVAAALDGTGYNLVTPAAGGTFKVLSGSTDLTGNAAVTYSVVAPATIDGLTITLGSNGVYSLSGVSWSSDSVAFTLRAVTSGVTIDKVYSITKSKTGATGANAKLVNLVSDKQTFTKDGTGAFNPTSQTINFSGSRQNITTAITWSVAYTTDGINWTARTLSNTYLTTSSDTASMTRVQFTSLLTDGGTVGIAAKIRATADSLFDEITVIPVQDGAEGIAGVNGTDGVDTGLIFDFSQIINVNSINRPYGWNNSSVSSTDLTSGNATTSPLRPSYSPSGALSYPTGIQTVNSSSAKFGGRLADFSGSGTANWFRYFYTAEPISVGINNTYEISYRSIVDTTSTTVDVGLFFFDITGTLITATSNVQTSFPHIITDWSKNTTGATVDNLVRYYSFETGSSVRQFPTNTTYVKPFVRLRGAVSSTCRVYIDKLYFGEKTTPNTRTGIFIDNIAGRVVIGESAADIAGGSGGLTNSKYDATANFEIISSGSGIGDVADIKITRAHPYVYTSASYGDDVAIGRDFAALRFAGWNGTFGGTSISSPGNMIIDERAEIRATYMRTGSANLTAGALGGASLDFYTAPSRTTASFGSTTAGTIPLLRARITDQGQFLVGYSDATSQIESFNPIVDKYTTYNSLTQIWTNVTKRLWSNKEKYPKLSVTGAIFSDNIITSNPDIENFITGTLITDVIYPVPVVLNKSGQIAGTTGQAYNVIAGKYLGSPRYRWDYTFTRVLELHEEDDHSTTSLGITNSKRYYSKWRIKPIFQTANHGAASVARLGFYCYSGDGSFNRQTDNLDDGSYPEVTDGGGDATPAGYDWVGYVSSSIGSDYGSNLMNFTGQHRNIPYDNEDYTNKIGLIVVSCGEYNSPYYDSININEALPKIKLSNKKNQKNVFGVISNKEDENKTIREYTAGNFISIYKKPENDNRLIINSLGEGGIWVCNINGNLENGDYITTCEIPGHGMKQDDDLLHNYTVAKITCDCDFDLNSPIYICQEFDFEGKTYRKAFVGCTYHCG